MSKEKRIEELREILGHKLISKGEFEKEKKKIEEEPEKEDPDDGKEMKKKEHDTLVKEERKKPDKAIVISIIILILAFAAFFSFRFFSQPSPETLDEYHLYNMEGKLKPDLGYIYGGVYSFVFFDDSWYLQLKSPGGTRLYNMALRFGPRDLEDLSIGGKLDLDLFNDADDYYVTFNPVGNDFSHVALAVGDFNTHMLNVFFKSPIPACDRNETLDCSVIPTITCHNTDKVVLYVKEANESNTYYDDNCIVVEGTGFDLVRGVDRVLLNMYGIMGQ